MWSWTAGCYCGHYCRWKTWWRDVRASQTDRSFHLCPMCALPGAVLVWHILSADERHMNVLSAHSLLYRNLSQSLLSTQASPVDKNILMTKVLTPDDTKDWKGLKGKQETKPMWIFHEKSTSLTHYVQSWLNVSTSDAPTQFGLMFLAAVSPPSPTDAISTQCLSHDKSLLLTWEKPEPPWMSPLSFV